MKASCQRKDPLKWSVADIHIVQCSNKILQLKRICYRKYLELVAEKASWCHKVTELNVRLLTRHFRICGKEDHLLGPTVTFLTYRYFKNLYKTEVWTTLRVWTETIWACTYIVSFFSQSACLLPCPFLSGQHMIAFCMCVCVNVCVCMCWFGCRQ